MQTFSYAVKPFNPVTLEQQLATVVGYHAFSIATATDETQTILVYCDDAVKQSAVDTVVANHDATQMTDEQQATATTAADTASAKQLAIDAASKAVGVKIAALTVEQTTALVACLLWKAGGIDQNGVVQPLAAWL